MDETETDKLTNIIWDYLHLNQKLEKADCILVLGSNDLRVAEYGAKLFLEGWAPWIIFSGGLGRLTKENWQEPEADKFARVAISLGVSQEKILIENKSSNTGENIQFTKKLLSGKGIDPRRLILVQKPYMERRAYATISKFWPEKEVVITSPPIPFKNYPNELIPREEVIQMIVGDLQRIKLYAERGFQIYQDIPVEVWEAYQKLVAAGYTKYLVV